MPRASRQIGIDTSNILPATNTHGVLTRAGVAAVTAASVFSQPTLYAQEHQQQQLQRRQHQPKYTGVSAAHASDAATSIMAGDTHQNSMSHGCAKAARHAGTCALPPLLCPTLSKPRATEAPPKAQQHLLDTPEMVPPIAVAAAPGALATRDSAFRIAPPPKRQRRVVPSTNGDANAAAITTTTTIATNTVASAIPPPAPPPSELPVDDGDGHFIIRQSEEINDNYVIIRQLGQGTFGTVALCLDRAGNRKVALKIIRAIKKYREASEGEIRLLRAIARADPNGRHKCIALDSHFDFKGHACMVFPFLGISLFDFVKKNQFLPFSLDEVRVLAMQLLDAVAFLHNLRIVHTDLKPENILLVCHDSDAVQPYTKHVSVSTRAKKKTETTQQRLRSLEIRVIDFGSAIVDDAYHYPVVSTRHYRAPEITLEIGWSLPCDLWSVGCIFVELAIGEPLFQAHENLEHLAMMETILGGFPRSFLPRASKWINDNLQVRYPTPDTERQNVAFIKSLKQLRTTLGEIEHPDMPNFYDLACHLLRYEPSERCPAAHALTHPFIRRRQVPELAAVNRSTQSPIASSASEEHLHTPILYSSTLPPLSNSSTTSTSGGMQINNYLWEAPLAPLPSGLKTRNMACAQATSTH